MADFGIAQAITGGDRRRTSPRPARSWAPPPTSRPSRPRASRSIPAATSTRSAACSSRCSRAGRRSAATRRWPSPTSTCRRRRPLPPSVGRRRARAARGHRRASCWPRTRPTATPRPRTSAPTSATSSRACRSSALRSPPPLAAGVVAGGRGRRRRRQAVPTAAPAPVAAPTPAPAAIGRTRGHRRRPTRPSAAPRFLGVLLVPPAGRSASGCSSCGHAAQQERQRPGHGARRSSTSPSDEAIAAARATRASRSNRGRARPTPTSRPGIVFDQDPGPGADGRQGLDRHHHGELGRRPDRGARRRRARRGPQAKSLLEGAGLRRRRADPAADDTMPRRARSSPRPRRPTPWPTRRAPTVDHRRVERARPRSRSPTSTGQSAATAAANLARPAGFKVTSVDRVVDHGRRRARSSAPTPPPARQVEPKAITVTIFVSTGPADHDVARSTTTPPPRRRRPRRRPRTTTTAP